MEHNGSNKTECTCHRYENILCKVWRCNFKSCCHCFYSSHHIDFNTMDKKEIEINGKRVCYSTYGNGKPVLFVHGVGALSAVWNNQVDALKDSFKLITVDVPGSS